MSNKPAVIATVDIERRPFTVSTIRKSTATILSVSGEIDLLTVDPLRRAITDAFDTGTENLLVDLTCTTFLASAGLHALEQAREHTDTIGGLFAVVAVQPSTTRPIVALQLDQILGLRPSVDEVIESWNRPDVRWPEPSPLDGWWIEVMSPAKPLTPPRRLPDPRRFSARTARD